MKKFYCSKTLIFNTLAILIMVAQGFGYTGEMSAETKEYANQLVPIIVALTNMGLRMLTEHKITK